MKKIAKICLLSAILLLTFACVFCGTYVTINYLKFQQIPLNAESLTSPALSIAVFDQENIPMKEENQFNGDFCALDTLHDYTKQAFLSIEDKDFYNHNGLNKKRIAKAMVNNLKSGSLKEGASTISQQLIKNTHLTNEKTFERKLKEMALTKKLENSFEKDEILESYLNIIFFGNNCYGLESASKYYFNKSAKDLTLNESCTLAGLIKSPGKYSPILNYENSLKRRNIVLSEMEKDGKITVDEKIKTQNEPIKLEITKKTLNKLNSYSQASIDEASKILNLSAKQLAIAGYKIHTYCDKEKQEVLKNAILDNQVEDADSAGIVIDAQKHGVLAYYGDSNYKLMDIKRQPASCIKPLLVYGPALNEDVISPSTQILDEPLKIGNYEPANVNKKFSGYISITDAVKNSINIPAIKVLSYIGIDTGKQYAEKLGISFDEKDDSYALALGGMTYGLNLKTLASAYSVFPNKGQFCDASFVQYITDSNNKLVYVHKPQEQMVFREDSAYLMTSILEETAKTGTARKLSDLEFDVAAKTGTVGKKNASGNTDAYNICYTPTEVVGIWFGNLDNIGVHIAGGNQPTEVAKSYLKAQNYENVEFEMPSSVTEVKIDALEKEESHRLVLASPYTPERYTENALFSRFNLPTDVSQNFLEQPKIDAECKLENGQIVLTIKAQKHLEYQIFKDNLPTQTISEKQGEIKIRMKMDKQETEVKLVANYLNANSNEMKSQKVFKLSKKNVEKQEKAKWYI